MSEEGAEMTRGRRMSPAAPAPLPDDDDLLQEILLRLPPRPSSLPRASLVCKRWRRLATDPQFLRRFRVHHRKPPVLGLFSEWGGKPVFDPILRPPDRIPPERFSLRVDGGSLLGCRHGLVLLVNWRLDRRHELIVWDPITGEHRRVAMLPEFYDGKMFFEREEVLCAAGDQGHVHGGCHSSPFKLVVVLVCRNRTRLFIRVYSSETGEWGNLISREVEFVDNVKIPPGKLVGNALYWLFNDPADVILEFHFGRESLAVIEMSPMFLKMAAFRSSGQRMVVFASPYCPTQA